MSNTLNFELQPHDSAFDEPVPAFEVVTEMTWDQRSFALGWGEGYKGMESARLLVCQPQEGTLKRVMDPSGILRRQVTRVQWQRVGLSRRGRATGHSSSVCQGVQAEHVGEALLFELKRISAKARRSRLFRRGAFSSGLGIMARFGRAARKTSCHP